MVVESYLSELQEYENIEKMGGSLTEEEDKRKRIIQIRRSNAKVPEFDFNQIALQSDSFASDVASAELGSLSAEDQLKELGL